MESSVDLLEEMAQLVPAVEFQQCSGVVIVEVFQGGLFLSAQIGRGILMRHDAVTNAWSPPLAIGMTGVGAGLLMGFERKTMVIFLNGDQMTNAMSSDFSLRLGMQNSIVLYDGGETLDMTAQLGNKGYALTSAYTSTEGLYFGPLEVDGAAMAPRTAVNEQFYGQKLPPKQVVHRDIGEWPNSDALERLHAKLMQFAQAANAPAGRQCAGTSVDPFLKHTNVMMNGATLV